MQEPEYCFDCGRAVDTLPTITMEVDVGYGMRGMMPVCAKCWEKLQRQLGNIFVLCERCEGGMPLPLNVAQMKREGRAMLCAKCLVAEAVELAKLNERQRKG